MQRRNSKFSLVFAAAGVAALLLTACGPAGPNAEPKASESGTPTEGATSNSRSDTQSPGSEGEAILSYGDKEYSAQLDFCSIYDTGDALFHGVALDEAGNEAGFLEGDFVSLNDSPHGEARIDFGATAKMQSMDTFVSMGDAVAEIVVTDLSEGSLIVMGGVWDENGTVLSTGTVRVTCE